MTIITTAINKIMHKDHDPGAGWMLTAKLFVCLALFLMPLFVGWWTTDLWESHKVLLLLLFSSLGWICFWIAGLLRRSISWNWRRFDWLAIGVLLAAFLSTITSVRPWAALVAATNWYAETLPALVGLVAMYLLIVQLFRQRHDQIVGWTSLVSGLVIAVLLQLFQFANFSIWPVGLPQAPLFSSISTSIAQLAIVAGIVGALPLLAWSQARERWLKIVLAGSVVIGWLVLLISGQMVGWAVFALGMIIVVLLQAQQGNQGNVRLIGVAVVLAVAGIVAQLTNLSAYSYLGLTREPQLDTRTSAVVAGAAFQRHPVFGSGPGTWYYDFVAYRPDSFNLTPYWNLRFAQAGSAWWHIWATTGLVGLLAWASLLTVAVLWLWRQWRRQASLGASAALLIIMAMILASFFVTWSLVAMWLLFAAIGLARAKTDPNPNSQPLNIWAGLGFAATVIFALLWIFPAGRIYISDIITQQAVKAINRTEPLPKVQARLRQALRLNNRNQNAAALLANAYTVEFSLAVQQGDTSQAQVQTQRIADQLTALQQLDPRNPVGYEISNNILSSLTGLVGEVELQAARNFATLRQLEPGNPIHDVGYGQTLMVSRARLAAKTDLTEEDKKQMDSLLTDALAAYDQALRKKSDYFQAQLAKAQAWRAGGQYQSALDALQPLLNSYPTVAVLWLEQADDLSQLNQGDAAVASFEQSIRLDASDPNVYLAFADHYQRAKNKDQAKEILQRGLTALPGDSQLQQTLDSLK